MASVLGDLSDNEKAEDNLKENLPFHEGKRNFCD